MRITFLTWRDLAHPRSGGAEVLAQGLAQRLARDSHDVAFFSARVTGRPDVEQIDGVKHVRGGGRFSVYLEAHRWLRRTRHEYDLLIDHINTVPFFTPLYERERVVALVPQLARNVWWYEAPKFVAPLGIVSERLYHRLYRTTPAITISQSTADDLRAFGWQAPIRTIAMPLSETRPQQEFGLSVADADRPREQPTVIFVGRLTPSKRVEHAIEAFAEVRFHFPNARLWIVGCGDDPNYEKRLRARASRVGGVEFAGRAADAELRARMGKATVIAVTSVREGWGLVVTEANAVGTPAAGYDVPGLRDSIKPGQGVLVRSGDARGLGAAIAALLADPARLKEMSARARADAAQYSWQRTYAEFVQALRELKPGLFP